MTLLVLCIDRDNDFGTKAGIQSPIIGREANVKAATALGLADPEDSDMNSLFGAIKIFDEFIAKGREAEVVTVCGSQRVGPHSDTLIAEQLDELVARLKVDRVVFVTDGAEDEFILPLVTSRVKVEAVHRVIVRQHQDLEGTYYIIKKAFEDDKLKRSILVPFALALIVYGVFAFYDKAAQGLGAIAALVGFYFIAKIVRLGDFVRGIVTDLTSALAEGKFTVFTSVIAGVLVLMGGSGALQGVPPGPSSLAYAFAFGGAMLWWLVAAAMVHLGGRVLDTYVKAPRQVWDYWMMPFSLAALGLMGSAVLAASGRAIAGEQFSFRPGEFLELALGIVVAFAGAGSNAVVKGRLGKRREARPAEAREG